MPHIGFRFRSLASGFVAYAALGLLAVSVGLGCGGGADPNNLTPEQEQNIQDELQSQEELADQPPI